jgi:plastocyanin
MTSRRIPELLLAALAAALVVGGAVALAQDRDEPAAEAAPGATEVAISGFLFGPKELTVPAGATVTWTSSDDTQHTVTGRDAAAKGILDSENLRSADTYAATFDAPGSYEYFCVFHPNMQGTITVEG